MARENKRSQNNNPNGIKNIATCLFLGAALVKCVPSYLEQTSSDNQRSFDRAPVEYVEQQPLTEIGQRMLDDLAPYNVVDADEVNKHMQQTGKNSEYFGEQISKEDSMRYFYIAGFRGEDLQRITAISWRESQRYPGAFGDNNFRDTGSKSVGLTQIRCITEGNELPCDGSRDWTTNFDPMVAAQHTYDIAYNESVRYNGYGSTDTDSMGYDGRFRPWNWSDYHVRNYGNDPAFYEYLPEVREIYTGLENQYGNLAA